MLSQTTPEPLISKSFWAACTRMIPSIVVTASPTPPGTAATETVRVEMGPSSGRSASTSEADTSSAPTCTPSAMAMIDDSPDFDSDSEYPSSPVSGEYTGFGDQNSNLPASSRATSAARRSRSKSSPKVKPFSPAVVPARAPSVRRISAAITAS